MKQVYLKEIRDFEPFKFSEFESNCLKLALRASGAGPNAVWMIGYVSVSKELFYADPLTLVLVSDEPNKNPLYNIV